MPDDDTPTVDEHEHSFNTPIDVFEADGVTHHRANSCGECGALEDEGADKPPALSQMRKAELLEHAEKTGVDVSEDMTVPEIRDALSEPSAPAEAG